MQQFTVLWSFRWHRHQRHARAHVPRLFWASDDGFGVRGGELDEINFPETLTVDFYTPRTVTGVWFTDLFQAPDGGSDGEEAIVEL